MSSQTRPITVRVRGLPNDSSSAALTIDQILQSENDEQPQYKVTILPSCQRSDELAALVDFPNGLPDCLAALWKDGQATYTASVDDEDILFDVHFVGFTQLSIVTEPIDADIIAICGIDGHAYGSWQEKVSRRMWLRHFLPKDVPASWRILTYGYSGKLARNDFATADDYASEFLDALKLVRKGAAQDRPIVFIAHSFGGLILAQALIKAASGSVKTDKALVSIYSSLSGILSFAVPHRGLDIDDMSRIMGEENHPRSGLLQHISINSEALRLQSEQFRDLMFGHKIVSFFETEQTRRLRRSSTGAWTRTGELFTSLPRDSAILALPSQIETRIPLHKDHSSIVKFDSKYDVGYEHTVHHLKQFLSQSLWRQIDPPINPSVEQPSQDPVGKATVCEIPFPRDQNFVHRKELMYRLNQECMKPASRTVLVGLGGVGKSQLAVEYAHQIYEESDTMNVFWIHASNLERLEQGIEELVERLNIVKRPDSNVFRLFQQWSQKNKNWLLILDNMDDDQFLFVRRTNKTSNATDMSSSQPLISYLPQSQNGSILFTTRSMRVAQNLADPSNIIVVDVMTEVEATELLLQKMNLPDGQNKIECSELVRELDCMPLAIIQAAAYINQRSCSIAKYLELFRNNDKGKTALLTYEAGKPRRDWDSSSAILITWQLSFEFIRRKNKHAADMLSIFSLLDRQGIPKELVRQILLSTDENNEPATNEIDFEEAVLVLQEYAMAAMREDTQSFHVHRLIQLATRYWLSKNGMLLQWERAVVSGLSKALPPLFSLRWTESQRIFPHFSSIRALQSEGSSLLPEWAMLCSRIAIWRWLASDHTVADELSAHAVSLARSNNEIGQAELIHIIMTRSQIAAALDQTSEALASMREACKLAEKGYTCDPSMKALSMAISATIYKNLGHLEKAEHIARASYAEINRLEGPMHPHTNTAMQHLANILTAQKRFAEAESLHRATYHEFTKQFGPDHGASLSSLAHLALACAYLGKFDEAIELQTSYLELTEKVYGKDHALSLGAKQDLQSLHNRVRK